MGRQAILFFCYDKEKFLISMKFKCTEYIDKFAKVCYN